jgi:hypothetical protein
MRLMNHSEILPGTKFLTPLNYIRCGLADAIFTDPSTQLHKGAKYGVNWMAKSKEDLAGRNVVITQAFKDTSENCSIYQVLEDIFGPNEAVKLCERDACKYPSEFTRSPDDNCPSAPNTTGEIPMTPPPSLHISTSRQSSLGPKGFNPVRYSFGSAVSCGPNILSSPSTSGFHLMTPKGGLRAVEPNFSHSIRLGAPNMPALTSIPGPSSSTTVRPAIGPNSGLLAGVAPTSPPRFTVAQKGKRKMSLEQESTRHKVTRRL